jgi:hypothetical protein
VDTPSDAPTITSHPTTPVTFESIGIKHKRSKIFSPIIEVIKNNNKSIIETMEYMNVTQLDIKKCHKKV